MIWNKPFTLDEINQRAALTLSEHLQIQFTEIGNDSLSATMPIDHRTLQPMGVLHGGATCALAETVGSAAAYFTIDSTHQACVGLNMNVHHIKQVRSGKVTAVAKPLHLGKSTQVWEIKVYSEDGKLVSTASLTMLILVKKKPESFNSGIYRS